jgi:ketosteroid isomerase-like protein
VSHENVERAYLAYDAIRRRDVEAFLGFMDTDVECVPLLMEPDGASYHGHEGIRRWLDELFSVFPAFSADIREVRDFGDLLVVAAGTRGQGVGSDVPFQATVWQVVEVRDGKVIRWRNYWSEAEALEAGGAARLVAEVAAPRGVVDAK